MRRPVSPDLPLTERIWRPYSSSTHLPLFVSARSSNARRETIPKALDMAAPNSFGELGLSIVGLGVEYPPHQLTPSSLDTLSKRYYPESPA